MGAQGSERRPIELEICVDTLAGAVAAHADGADRLELCARLDLDGLTPAPELLQAVQAAVSLPLMIMIRPQAGSFQPSASEFEVMQDQVRWARNSSVHGLVFGILQADGRLDRTRCATLLELADPLPCTFHRAFDQLEHPLLALTELQDLGFRRILSSGCASSAMQGLAVLEGLLNQAGSSMTILPGGGVRPHNAEQILSRTGASELHSSATTGWRAWKGKRQRNSERT
jgi:copper homeostasis protein